MTLIKRTYSLPGSVVESFETEVPSGERSNVLATLMVDWLDRQHRLALRKDISEGCAAMADLYLEIEKEYHPLEEELHRVIEEQPPAGRRRARAARSSRRVGTSR